MNRQQSLQRQYAAKSICFGCGPSNEHGLRLESFVADLDWEPTPNATARIGDVLIASFTPRPYHMAFEGVVNGGIISVLLDCHLNWTAVWNLMQQQHLQTPPGCVTAKYEVTFLSPTPADQVLQLEAWVETIEGRKVGVSGVLGPLQRQGTNTANISPITATAKGTFVAVKPDHPAYRRW